jgi:hypothetical protein
MRRSGERSTPIADDVFDDGATIRILLAAIHEVFVEELVNAIELAVVPQIFEMTSDTGFIGVVGRLVTPPSASNTWRRRLVFSDSGRCCIPRRSAYYTYQYLQPSIHEFLT